MALASNAPTPLKIQVSSHTCLFVVFIKSLLQALRLLPANLNFPLIAHVVTPYMPVPETNGEEWDRLEPMVTLDALIELVVHGEYAGADGSKRKGKEPLLLRTAGSAVFEVRSLGINSAEVVLILFKELYKEGRGTPPYLESYVAK